MIKKFLTIRLFQIKRSVQDLAGFHIIALSLMVIGLGLSIISGAQKNPNFAKICAGAALAGVFYIHLNRPDKRFISTISNRPYLVFMAEYLLFTAPIWVYLLWVKNGVLSLIFIFLILCISFINKSLVNFKGVSIFSKLIPHSAFEWKAGMRKWGIQLVFLYGLAPALSWIRVAPFILLFIALVTMAQFFFSCEPLSILSLSADKTNVFLRKKIGQSLLIYSLLTLPVIITSLILVPEMWYLGLAFYILACINVVNFILGKYAYYHPNHNTGGGNIINQMGLFAVVVPILLPISLFLVFWNYFKAKPKLDYYLND